MKRDIAYKYSDVMEHEKWLKEIPYIRFQSDWDIKVSPPFGGAVVRFLIRKVGAEVSVYLDCYDMLGYVEEPYWEVYPHGSDVARCYMNDTESLIELIKQSITEQHENTRRNKKGVR